MTTIPEEWREKLKALYDDFYVGYDSGYFDDIYLSSAPDYELKKLEDFLHHQLQKAREESGKEMFNRIKADITKLEYETDGDTFKKIVLSRLSSLAWFDALHHSELDQDKALQDNK